jgi:hypothetical protein
LQSIGESPIKKKKSRRGQVPYKENEKNWKSWENKDC